MSWSFDAEKIKDPRKGDPTPLRGCIFIDSDQAVCVSISKPRKFPIYYMTIPIEQFKPIAREVLGITVEAPGRD